MLDPKSEDSARSADQSAAQTGSLWPDRVVGLVLMTLASFIIVGAIKFHVPYQYEPLGPRFFPYAVGTVLLLAGVVLVLRPHVGELSLAWRQYLLFGILLAYAVLFELLGFLLSTILVLVLATRLAGQSWRAALLGAFGIGGGAYLLLALLLQLQLPQGSLWAF